MPSTPLFTFGYELGCTTFSYSPLKLENDTVDVGGELRLYLTVTNIEEWRGIEIVQLYVCDTATDITLPAQQLVGSARLDLELGASKKVSFVIPMSLLGYMGICRNFVIEPGPMEVSAGSSSSNDIRSSAKFTVTGNTLIINRECCSYLSTTTTSSE